MHAVARKAGGGMNTERAPASAYVEDGALLLQKHWIPISKEDV